MASKVKSGSTARVRKSEDIGSNANQRIRLRKELLEKKQDSKAQLSVTEAIAQSIIYKQLESRQFDDPFVDSYQQFQAQGLYLPIEPTYNPNIIRRIPQENNILNQCIDAMVQNIEGTGHTFEYIGPKTEDGSVIESPEAKAEKSRIEAFVSSPNEEYSFEELRRRLRRDKETFGYAFIEVVRDISGIVHTIYHIPAHSVRATSHDPDMVDMSILLRRGDREEKINRRKRFRRFVQQDAIKAHLIYFKEFGDPRIINIQTGRVDESTPLELRATEILMFSDYKPGSLYGYPRWVNQLPSILGSRESEIVNLEFFKDNAIPALALLVSGGSLSTDAIDAIADKFVRGRGRGRMNDILVLEATGDQEAAKPDGQIPVPRLEMKPMTRERQNDAMFQEYDKQCQTKIRSAFRLPPLVLGLSDDYTYATADASMTVCESQVFTPERQDFDEVVNKALLGDGVNPPIYWRFKSNPTRIVDKGDIANSMTSLENVGALTPNVAIGVANQLFGLQIPTIKFAWGDYPYSLTLGLIQQGHEINDLEGLATFQENMAQALPKENQVNDKAKKQVIHAIGKMVEKMELAQNA